jgi:protein arginine kinase activator
MKCDLCPQDATVFLTQIINGQMTTVNLCDACSKAKGVTDTMGFGLAEAFLSGTSTGTTSMPTPNPLPQDACPSCGFTYAQLKKIGRMGCPDCYTAFREGLDGLLSAMHKGTRHVGKTPLNLAASMALAQPPRETWSREDAESKIEQLRKQIQIAVKDERYEDAASHKLEIDSLLRRIEQEEA